MPAGGRWRTGLEGSGFLVGFLSGPKMFQKIESPKPVVISHPPPTVRSTKLSVRHLYGRNRDEFDLSKSIFNREIVGQHLQMYQHRKFPTRVLIIVNGRDELEIPSEPFETFPLPRVKSVRVQVFENEGDYMFHVKLNLMGWYDKSGSFIVHMNRQRSQLDLDRVPVHRTYQPRLDRRSRLDRQLPEARVIHCAP